MDRTFVLFKEKVNGQNLIYVKENILIYASRKYMREKFACPAQEQKQAILHGHALE